MKRIKKLILAAPIYLSLHQISYGQSVPPYYTYGTVPTAGEWQASWASKQDVLTYVPCSTLGCTMLGELTTVASSATSSGFTIPPGVAPTTPNNGDVWVTTAGMFVRANGITIGPFGSGLGGTVTVPQGGTGQVTFTANQPLLGAGSAPLIQGSLSGNTTILATSNGTLTNGHCVSIDSNFNFIDAGGPCTTGGGGGTVSAATIGRLATYTGTATVGGLATCNNGYIGTSGSGANSCLTTVNGTLSATITQLGTVVVGTWQATIIGASYGGTGINNGASTITLGGPLTLSGAFPTQFTVTGSTSVTLPTSGLLMNQIGTSGGIPYYSSNTTTNTSSVLSANNPIVGGGAGSAPSSASRSGNTTEFVTTTGVQTAGSCVTIDSNGNHIASGSSCAASGAVLLNVLTASGTANLQDTTSLTSLYGSYTIVFVNLLPANNGVTCQMLLQSGGTFKSSGYSFSYMNGNGTVFAGNSGTSLPCSWADANEVGNSSEGFGITGSYTIYTPSNAGITPQLQGSSTYTSNTGQQRQSFAAGSWGTPGAITGIQVSFSSGNVASGSIRIYGNP